MRIAVLADIHGNIHAFEAVLEHLQQQSVDQIVIAGDIINGLPHSHKCWEKIQSLNCIVIRGNHERYLFDFDSPHAPDIWKTELYGPVHQTYQQLSKDTIHSLANLPTYHRINNVLIVHASYRNDVDAVEHKTNEELDAMFGNNEPFIIRAHNHIWFQRQWKSREIFSIGSVGLPLNGNTNAQYAIATQTNAGWVIEKQYVAYDIQHALQSFDASGYFDLAGSMGKLFYRELLTAKHQLTPFLQRFGDAYEKGELTLEQAVNKYLSQ